ncbi:hypothetical protein ACQPYK_02830 [Streptosporangium sp. CA-135522]|uniref:hypothetical protein n=1 Tax=Streptosporangium sp. CA-135522 TaxID=3240072 RepID=UPI003D8EBC8F
MRKPVYYIDGFIAGPEGWFDFFAFEGDLAAAVLADHPETMPGPAREPLGIAGKISISGLPDHELAHHGR